MSGKTFRRMTGVTLMAVTGALFLLAGSASAGGGCHLGATEATGTEVDLKEMCFTPTVLHVDPGQTVTWTNRDEMQHVVAGQGGEWGNFEGLSEGQALTYRFTKAGVYPYTCFLHPGMNGAVIVGDVKAPVKPVSAGGGVVAAPKPPSPRAESLPADAAANPRVAPAVESATPWKVAAGIGFGLFALTLLGLGLILRPRRRKTVPVVA